MKHLSKILLSAIAVCALAIMVSLPARAQQNPPAVLFESLMDSYFGNEDGLVSFGDYDIVFAPEGQAQAVVGVLNKEGAVMGQFPGFAEYKRREGVFARLQVQGPADVQLTEPGVYTLVFVLDGKPITRFPFVLRQSGSGDDPYNPQKTFVFDGYWRTLAHITTDSFKGEAIPVISVWLGGVDMPAPDTFQAFFHANLSRDGTLVAHSKRQTSFYSNGHFQRREFQLYQPHDEKQAPNAIPLTMKELLVDGQYVLKVVRASDESELRAFQFTVQEGKIQPLPRSQLGYEPAVDFIVPRVTKKGSTGYEFVEAVWISTP